MIGNGNECYVVRFTVERIWISSCKVPVKCSGNGSSNTSDRGKGSIDTGSGLHQALTGDIDVIDGRVTNQSVMRWPSWL